LLGDKETENYRSYKHMTATSDPVEKAQQFNKELQLLIDKYFKDPHEPPNNITGIIILRFQGEKNIIASVIGKISFESASLYLYELDSLNKILTAQECATCG